MTGAKLISTLTTSTGTKVRKLLESQPMQEGLGRVVTHIQYPKHSTIAKLGVDSVFIRNAGKEGKHIMAVNGDRCIALGVTNPSNPYERPIQKQLKAIFDAVKLLRNKGVIQ